MDRKDIHNESMRLGHDAAWELDWERAAGYYNKALAEMPGSVEAMKALGLALLESGRHSAALGAYLQAAGADPGDPVAREKCAVIHEGLGHLKEALEYWEAAADRYSRRRDIEEAIASWAHMARLTPGNLAVRSRLALTYERLGRRPRAMEEYLAIASILQQSGRPDRAIEAVQRAIGLMPGELTAGEALRALREGRLLPPPAAPRPHTSPLRTEEVTAYLSEDLAASESGADDPEAEAQRVALQLLAGLLFEEPTQYEVVQIEKAGMRGKPDGRRPAPRSQMVRILTEAIGLQSRDEPAQAVLEYERAIAAGLDHPAAHFVVGRLYKDLGQPEMAIAHLEAGAQDPDLALGSNLALGRMARQANNLSEAACHLLEALRLADGLSASPSQTAQLDAAYEAIRGSLDAEDSSSVTALVDQTLTFLAGPGWRANVGRARESLSSHGETDGPGTIAEVIQNGGTDAVLQAMARIEELMARGLYGSAMEETYLTLDRAPHYLSLHLRMAEILLREERIGPAVEKMKLVAATYRLRGQGRQAADVYQQVLSLSPLDLALRTELIGLLTDQNRVDEAADQYLELHTLHCQMAEIEQARASLERALELADTGTLSRSRHLAILNNLADIDNSLLNWSGALGVYTQIRSVDPSNERARRECVELNLRLGHEEQAARDLDGLLEELVKGGRTAEALQLLEETAREHSGRPSLHARLAEAYRAAGRTSDAIAQYDALGEIQLDAGAVVPAIHTIRILLSLNPPDGDSYRELLRNLEAGT